MQLDLIQQPQAVFLRQQIFDIAGIVHIEDVCMTVVKIPDRYLQRHPPRILVRIIVEANQRIFFEIWQPYLNHYHAPILAHKILRRESLPTNIRNQ